MSIQTDYLVVGAGACGLAFTDSMLEQSDAEIAVVDRRPGPGGHWRDCYPFVRLHSPSAYYGVNSIHLGEDRIYQEGRNKGFYEQASGADIQAYFDNVVTERLEPSGQVRTLLGFEHLGSENGAEKIRDVTTGDVHEVEVRRRIVDARYQEASVPATHTPAFAVSPRAAFVPVGELPDRAADYRRFAIIGSGKTAVDACLWLLDNGVDADAIRWIRPRDAWFHNRATYQPLDLVGSTVRALADTAEAAARTSSIGEFFHRLEDEGHMMRLDTTVEPSMFRATMLSEPELDLLRQITDVVRLGHLEEIRDDRLILEDGEIETGPDTLHVNCSARGLSASPDTEIFSPGRITLQQIRHASPTYNAAGIAVIEAHRSDDTEKNRLTPPNRFPTTPMDAAGMFSRTWSIEGVWLGDPDIGPWMRSSRLNLLKSLPEHSGEAAVNDDMTRFLSNMEDAIAGFRSMSPDNETATTAG